MWYPIHMNRKSRRALHAVRSKMRSRDELQKRYGEVCAQLGDIGLKIRAFTKAKNTLEQESDGLEREFQKLNASETPAPQPTQEEQPKQEEAPSAASETPAA